MAFSAIQFKIIIMRPKLLAQLQRCLEVLSVENFNFEWLHYIFQRLWFSRTRKDAQLASSRMRAYNSHI